MSIGKNISILRKAKGLTQAELGNLLGVSNQAVSKWESEMTMPDVMLLPEIARVLNVDLQALYSIPHEKTDVIEANSILRNGCEDRRILNISAKDNGKDAKVRMPVSALCLALKLCLDGEDSEEIMPFLSIFDNLPTGNVVDADYQKRACDYHGRGI